MKPSSTLPRAPRRWSHVPPEEPVHVPLPAPAAPVPLKPNWLLIVVIFLATALALVVGAGVLGYFDGLKDREERLQTEALEHYRAGVAHMEAGEYELAQAEFEEAIRLRPDFQPAWQRLRESQVYLEAIPTPTSVPLPTMTPAAEQGEGTPPPLSAWLAEARSLFQAGQYMDAVDRINDILKVDPNYEPALIADLLFQCYYQEALRLVGEDRMEEALRLFDLALAIRPDDQTVKRERELAAGYLSAIGFWGADWQKAVEGFSSLYRARPDYKDVASRLFNAYVAYGDMLAEQGAWCQAAEQYTNAANLQAKPQVVQKRDQMVDYCQRNVPPPSPAEGTGTPSPEATPGTPAPAGENAAALRELGLSGQIYYAVYDDARREYVLYAVGLTGSAPIEVFAGVHHPQVDRSGKRLVVRALSGVGTLGLYVIDLSAGVPPAFHLITSYTQDLYPSFSPDGQEVVFTSDRMSKRVWTLFTTWAGGEAEPRSLIPGQTPAWSPRGDTIAYKGCDESGNQCGIYLYRVADGVRQAILLDPSAGFPAWSPDGTRLAFMSNRDGNWEIYLVGADGQGLRRFTVNPANDGMPAWSPDGKAIAFLSDRDGQWSIYVKRVDDNRMARVIALQTHYADWLMERITWGPAVKLLP